MAVSERLAPRIPRDRIVVAESGLNAPADLARLARIGYPTFLIGESLMRQADVAAATRTILARAPSVPRGVKPVARAKKAKKTKKKAARHAKPESRPKRGRKRREKAAEAARQARLKPRSKSNARPATAPTPPRLSHIDQRGQARMVDVTEKGVSERVAVAEGRVIMRKETLDLVLEGNAMKGDVLGAARLAGIMAAKRTHGLIPLCHPLPLSKVEIEINPEHSLPGFLVQATVKVTAKTGVEMEALHRRFDLVPHHL